MPRDIFTNFRRRARQFEATRGRPIAPNVSRSFLEAEIASETERAGIEAERSERIASLQENRELARKQATAQRGADIVSGVTGLATTGALVSDSKLGTAVGSGARSIGHKLAPSLIKANAANVANAATSAGHISSVIPGVGKGVSFGGISGGGFAAPAPSLAGTAISALGPAAAGFAGKEIGEAIFGEDSTVGGLAGATASGALYGSIIPGFGTVIGAGLGFLGGGISQIAENSVICTELHRQGYIPDKVFALDDHTLHSDITEKIYRGYMRWAPTIVKWMQKSRIVTWIVRPIGVGWAYHMAHKLDTNIPDSLVGKIIYKIGVPICGYLGRGYGKFFRIAR